MQHATSGIAPRARQSREASDRADRHAAACVALQAVVDSDDRRPCGSVLAREAHDLVFGHAAYIGSARRRKLSNTLAEFVEPERVTLDVVAVFQFVADDHVHHRESKRSVGSRPNLYELM